MKTERTMGEDGDTIARKPLQAISSPNHVTLAEDSMSIASEDDIMILPLPPKPNPPALIIDDDGNVTEYNEDDLIIAGKPVQTVSSPNRVTLAEDSMPITFEDEIMILPLPPKPSPPVIFIEDDENVAEDKENIQNLPETECDKNASVIVIENNEDKPGKPGDLQVKYGSLGYFDLKWTHPISDGGSHVMSHPSHYIIEHKTRLGDWKPLKNVPASQNAATVTDLMPGLAYQFRVTAVSDAGRGEPSNASLPTLAKSGPPSVPEAPEIEVCEAEAVLKLRWKPPKSDGWSRITSYVIERRNELSQWEIAQNIPGDNLTAVIPYVMPTENSLHSFRIQALNKYGRSKFSTFTCPPSVPEAPEIEVWEAEAVLKLRWKPPKSDGWSPITSYVIERRNELGQWEIAQNVPGGNLTAAIPYVMPIENSVHSFRIQAVNKCGLSRFSTFTQHATMPKTCKRKRKSAELQSKSSLITEKFLEVRSKQRAIKEDIENKLAELKKLECYEKELMKEIEAEKKLMKKKSKKKKKKTKKSNTGNSKS